MSLASRLTMSFIAELGSAPGWKKILITAAPGTVRDSWCSILPARVRARSTRELTDFSMSIVGRPGYEKKLTTTGCLKSGRMSIVMPGMTDAPSRHNAVAPARTAKRFLSEKLMSPMCVQFNELGMPYSLSSVPNSSLGPHAREAPLRREQGDFNIWCEAELRGQVFPSRSLGTS